MTRNDEDTDTDEDGDAEDDDAEKVKLKHYVVLLTSGVPCRVVDTASFDDIIQRWRSEGGRKMGIVRFPGEGQLQQTDDDGELVALIPSEGIRADRIDGIKQLFPVVCDGCDEEVDPATELTELTDKDEAGKEIKVAVILCGACLDDDKKDDDDEDGDEEASVTGPKSPGGASIDFNNIKVKAQAPEAMPVGF